MTFDRSNPVFMEKIRKISSICHLLFSSESGKGQSFCNIRVASVDISVVEIRMIYYLLKECYTKEA